MLKTHLHLLCTFGCCFNSSEISTSFSQSAKFFFNFFSILAFGLLDSSFIIYPPKILYFIEGYLTYLHSLLFKVLFQLSLYINSLFLSTYFINIILFDSCNLILYLSTKHQHLADYDVNLRK